MKNRILIFGDLHAPFHNKRALKKALELVHTLKPTHVIQIGDLYDQYAFSRFTKKNVDLPQKELSRGIKAAKDMWDAVQKAHKGVKCFQILGNHDVRLAKRIAEKVPEAQELFQGFMNELYTFKGVKTIYDDREELRIGDIVFTHGYRSKLGDHSRFFGKRTVVGHSHTGGVVYEQRDGTTIWELNAGFLADEDSEPLRYRPNTTSRWTLGVGFIDEHGPRFIPFKKVA